MASRGAAAVWTHAALVDLDASIKALGSVGMTILDARNHSTVSTSGCLREFLSAVKAKALYFNRVCEPWKCSRDREIIEALTQPESSTSAITVHTFKSIVLFEPWDARPDTRPECMSLGFGSVGFFRRACASLKPPGEPLPAPSALSALAIPAPLMGTTTIRNLFLNKMPIAKTAPSKTTWKRSSRRHGRPLNCCRYCWIRRGVAVGTECHHYMSSSKTIQWDQGMRDFWDMTEARSARPRPVFGRGGEIF